LLEIFRSEKLYLIFGILIRGDLLEWRTIPPGYFPHSRTFWINLAVAEAAAAASAYKYFDFVPNVVPRVIGLGAYELHTVNIKSYFIETH